MLRLSVWGAVQQRQVFQVVGFVASEVEIPIAYHQGGGRNVPKIVAQVEGYVVYECHFVASHGPIDGQIEARAYACQSLLGHLLVARVRDDRVGGIGHRFIRTEADSRNGSER
jgi:hypothetical protein